jgi:hypothetical protein
MKQYRVSRCTGDAYAGSWVREQFQRHGIYYEISKQTRSELYLALLPLLNSRAVDLLDPSRLTAQLVSLERRTARSGRDSVDHQVGSHDDVANACAGAIIEAWERRGSGWDWSGANNHPRVLLGHASVQRRGMNDVGRVVPLHRAASSER